MSSELQFICQSLISNKDNYQQYDSILLQFISALQLDAVLLSNFVTDEYFPMFVQCLVHLIMRSPVPSPSEGKVPQNVITVVQFMVQLAYLDPDLSRIISANIPSDAIIANFFKRTMEDKKNRKANPNRMLPFMKLISLLSAESDLFLCSTESMRYVFVLCNDFFQIPDISKWALSTVAGLVRNCSAAASYLKSMPHFAKLRTDLGSLLSSEDPAVIIGALALLVLLFPSGVTPQTSVKAAISAVTSLTNFPPSVYLASWIIIELNESAPLIAEDLWALISAAMKGGIRAFVIYGLLIDLSSQHLMMLDVIQSMNCLFAMINTLIDSDEGFVAISGTSFLFTVFQDTNDFVLSEDVVEPFTKAMHLVLAMRKHAQSERREAAVMLLRFMVKCRESITYVVKIIQEHEQSLFLDFQRQIEMNNAFLSVVYFLFLFEVSHFLTHWRQKLIALVLDSQFPGLLVHVINESRNRRAIGDALRCSQILADGLKNDCIYQVSPVFDSLVSGYLLLNQKRYSEKRKEKSSINKVEEELKAKLCELEAERDCCEREIVTLRESINENSSSLEIEQIQRKTVEEENLQLKRALALSRSKAKKLMIQIKEQEDQIVGITQQLETNRKTNATISVREAGIRTQMTSISQLEAVLAQTQENCSKLEAQLKIAKDNAEKDRKSMESLKQKNAKLKKQNKALAQHINEATEQMHQIEEDRNSLRDQSNELKKQNLTLTQIKEQLEQNDENNSELIETLRNDLAKAKKERDEISLKAGTKLKSLDEIKSHMQQMEDKNNEFQMLIKLIHKTTYPNQKLPQTIATFMRTTSSQ